MHTSEASRLRVYPLEQYAHLGKRSTRPIRAIVENGRVVTWENTSILYTVLTAVTSRQNIGLVDRTRKKAYLSELYKAAGSLNIDEMKSVISRFPDAVPQITEVLTLPDEEFSRVAMQLASDFWI